MTAAIITLPPHGKIIAGTFFYESQRGTTRAPRRSFDAAAFPSSPLSLTKAMAKSQGLLSVPRWCPNFYTACSVERLFNRSVSKGFPNNAHARYHFLLFVLALGF